MGNTIIPMTISRLTVEILDHWCAANNVATSSLGRYLKAGADLRDRLMAGAMTLRTHDRVAKFLECHPIVPQRGLRDVANAFLAAEGGADARPMRATVEVAEVALSEKSHTDGPGALPAKPRS